MKRLKNPKFRKWLGTNANVRARHDIRNRFKHVNKDFMTRRFGDGDQRDGERWWAWEIKNDLAILIKINGKATVHYSTAGYRLNARRWTEAEIFDEVLGFIHRELKITTVDVMGDSIDGM